MKLSCHREVASLRTSAQSRQHAVDVVGVVSGEELLGDRFQILVFPKRSMLPPIRHLFAIYCLCAMVSSSTIVIPVSRVPQANAHHAWPTIRPSA